MMKTGNPKEIERLNDLLGRELGRNPYGASVFSWRWSEDCWWPATRTGRTVKSPVSVPIIGGGIEIVEHVVPEYKPQRQTKRHDSWYICKWLSPEELILGGSQGLGRGYAPGMKPNHDALARQWNELFPGIDFPSQGWRVPTNACLPRGPHDSAIPNLNDTNDFIAQIKEQTRLNEADSLARDLAIWDAHDEAQKAEIGDECRDLFPAYLNDRPGRRGGFVSMPSLETSSGKVDIIIP
jgi:hypothetical protein